jgi:hypothetical protein
MPHHQTTGQIRYTKVANASFENVAKIKYLGTTVTNQTSIHEEIKSKINSRNACCNAVQNILPSHLISKHAESKIYRTTILPVVSYGCES